MTDIDKFFADKCEVEIWDSNGGYKYNGQNRCHEWTIQDPRCREIIRERCQLTTDIRQDGSRYCFPRLNIDDAIKYIGNGKTLAEAEIACITAIYEADNNAGQ